MRRLLFLLSFILISLSQLSAQAPKITKIDPPNWWPTLPSPMLLLNGENLRDAHFTIQGENVSITRTESSTNGHWAFVWLNTASAAPQTLTLTASNASGEAKAAYTLAPRTEAPTAHAGFSSSDVMYLIMPDRFADDANSSPGLNRTLSRAWHGGNFAGIEQHLDYLHELGITTLWLTPIVSNGAMPESYHGYAATDLYAIDPHFGALGDYRHLSADLHARGIKLVQDFVPNHLGVRHHWVLDPPTPDWFHGTLASHTHTEPDFRALLDPHAPPRASANVTRGWFTDQMPDLNQENPLVSQYLIQNAIWWIETANLDGLRLDTFPYVGRAFWHDFHTELHRLYPHLTTVGEVMTPDAETTAWFAGGATHQGNDTGPIDTGLDTPFDYPVYFAIRRVLGEDKPFTDLAHVLSQDALYPHPERLVPFEGNHDVSRVFTAVHNSTPRLKLALGLATTLRGMPELYYGDEIAISGNNDPDNRHDFPGGFAGDTQNAFTQAGRTPQQQEVFAWTKSLIAARQSHGALQTGLQQNLLATDDLFAYSRTEDAEGCKPNHKTDRILIVVNKSPQPKTTEIPLEATALAGCTAFEPLLSTGSATHADSTLHIQAPAESLILYTVH